MERSSRSRSLSPAGPKKESRSPPRTRSPPALKPGSESKRRSPSRSPPRRPSRSPPRRRSRSRSGSRSRSRGRGSRYRSGSRSRSGSRDRHSSSRYDRERSSRYDHRDRHGSSSSRRSSRSRDRDSRYGGVSDRGAGSKWTSSYRRPPVTDDRRVGGYDARVRGSDAGEWRSGGGRSPPRYDRKNPGKPPPDAPTPEPSSVLGLFNLSQMLTEDKLREMLEKHGKLKSIILIKDRMTGLSKGYCFAYFEDVGEATTAREALNGQVIEGRQARVDYSRTNRPHSPTPGQYMGREDQVTDSRTLRRR